MKTISNLDFDTDALDQFYKVIEKVISRNNSTGLKTGRYAIGYISRTRYMNSL